jgi:hypothetical protein
LPLRLAKQAALSIADGAAVLLQVRKMRRFVLMVGIIGSGILVTLWLAALFIEPASGPSS